MPTPLRPTSTIFSPRLTMALKSSITCRSPNAFDSPLDSSATLPDGRFCWKRMYGRWMFERARSVVCSRSTSLRRDVVWLARVPAPKRCDEVLELRDLLLALRVLGLDAGADLRLGHHHVVVAAGVGDDRLVVDVGDVGADRVEEVAVVRDDDQRALVALEEALEPVDRVEVQVVGRLVEEQRRGRAEERLRQQHAHLLAALQFGHRPLVQRVGDVETLQQHRRVALGGVAVLLADDALELAEPHAVLVRHVGLVIEPVALGHRLPQAGVAHDHGVDDAVRVERELVLAQDAELRRADDRAFLRIAARRSGAS